MDFFVKPSRRSFIKTMDENRLPLFIFTFKCYFINQQKELVEYNLWIYIGVPLRVYASNECFFTRLIEKNINCKSDLRSRNRRRACPVS